MEELIALENLIDNIRCRVSRAAQLGEAVHVYAFGEFEDVRCGLVKLDRKVTSRLAAAEQTALAAL